jgi:hypothetical protein
MVDRVARRRLAELLRHVLAGQISKDEFLFEAEDLMAASGDDALCAVFAAVGSLYTDESALWNVHFRDSFRLPAKVRRRLNIAALFLYSDAEHQWPPSAGPRGMYVDCLLACTCGASILAGLIFLAVSAFSSWFAVVGVGCVAAAVWLYRLSQELAKRSVARWEAEQARYGDFDVWPFLRQADFEEAKRYPPLLCGRP